MKKKNFKFLIFWVIGLIVLLVINLNLDNLSYLFFSEQEECISVVSPLPEPKDKDVVEEIVPQKNFNLVIGGDAPYKPGERLYSSYDILPPASFYVYLWQPGIYYKCSYEECGPEGATIAALHGWLLGKDLTEDSREYYDLSPSTKSLVIVADRNSKIVGIYPNELLSDLLDVLKSNHADLLDLKLLEGITEIGDLKIGEKLPFEKVDIDYYWPGDVKDPSFYLFFIRQKTVWGCGFRECGAALEIIPYNNGVFIEVNEQKFAGLIEKMGFSSRQVGIGEMSAIVVADKDFKVLGIYPDKDMRDMYFILENLNLIKRKI